VDWALFSAPDGSAEFYIFSPLWNGEPKEIEPKPTEEIVTQANETKGDMKVRRMTLKARDGSYTRSFEDRENTKTNNRTTFAIKYKDQKIYDQYKSDYLHFKQSWKAWAD
jgi:hypothetical protein